MHDFEQIRLLTEIRDLLKSQTIAMQEWRAANEAYDAHWQRYERLQKSQNGWSVGLVIALTALFVLQWVLKA